MDYADEIVTEALKHKLVIDQDEGRITRICEVCAWEPPEEYTDLGDIEAETRHQMHVVVTETTIKVADMVRSGRPT